MCTQSQLQVLLGGELIRISVPYVYNLSEALLPLSSIKQGDTLNTHLYTLFTAERLLDQFLHESLWGRSLRVCKSPGMELSSAIKSLYEDLKVEDEMEYWKVVSMQQKLTAFKTVLEAEFLIAATYLVTARRGYDIATLIESAEVIFPDELPKKIPKILYDLREAGKCIAFDLGTAAGFHLLRALETVICCYWNVVMEGKPLPSNRNLGNYISKMEAEGKGEPKVLASLKQIKDHHRNSLMHPEETLDLDQAIALMGIVQSAIVAMLSVIPDDSGMALLNSPDEAA